MSELICQSVMYSRSKFVHTFWNASVFGFWNSDALSGKIGQEIQLCDE